MTSTIGNNSVPGQAGFNATVGYDQATGLGSIDGCSPGQSLGQRYDSALISRGGFSEFAFRYRRIEQRASL